MYVIVKCPLVTIIILFYHSQGANRADVLPHEAVKIFR